MTNQDLKYLEEICETIVFLKPEKIISRYPIIKSSVEQSYQNLLSTGNEKIVKSANALYGIITHHLN